MARRVKPSADLSVGAFAERAGLAVSAVHYYAFLCKGCFAWFSPHASLAEAHCVMLALAASDRRCRQAARPIGARRRC